MTDEQYLLLMDRLDRIEANTTKKKAVRVEQPQESYEEFIARMRAEFPEVWDFDVVVEECKRWYRALSPPKKCTRRMISGWLGREQKRRRENGTDVPPSKRNGGLVL